MPTPREKFQELLKKLFQFDCAELDFGIYRIMNHKRAVIERFIEKDLLDGVAMALTSGALAQESSLAQQLADVAAQIKENFGDDAIDAEGNLDEKYSNTPRGKQYLELRAKAGKAKSRPELEALIFNHLYTFLSRYYDDGDFMALRRYSKQDKYAIPYNGEEVYLHWANSDQYYIKTAENFTDYSYKHNGWVVKFALRNAEVEQSNKKGAKRFFLPRLKDVTLDTQGQLLTVPFEYRPLSEQEELTYKSKPQETILADASAKLFDLAKPEAVALLALTAEKRKDSDGNPVSMIEHHLRAYTRKNTSDFFIHKDLKGFLERELDFYIKNEVLNLDELEAGGEHRADSWFQVMSTMKTIGRKIIAFVAQIEKFQKRIFEKKKFVTEVNYCITLDRVPEELYPEIVKNKAQIEEWKSLFHIQEIKQDTTQPGFSEPLKVAFLKEHTHLVLDTKFFSSAFTSNLINTIPALDLNCSGLLIHSENYQALSLIRRRYDKSVALTYLDLPYNTGNDDFVYKDSYQHASWLSMASDRIAMSLGLQAQPSVIFCSIDDIELPKLRLLLYRIFGPDNKIGTVVWKGATDNNPTRIVIEHEYLLSYGNDLSALPSVWENDSDNTKEVMLVKYAELRKLLKKPIKIQAAFRAWIKENKEALQPLTHYDRVDDEGPYTGGRKVHNPGKEGYRYDVKHPITGMPCKQPARGYRFPESTMKKLLAEDRILFGEDHNQIIQIKEYLKDYKGTFKGIIELDSRTAANALEALFSSREIFRNPKPVELIAQLIEYCSKNDDLILDFVAGSGTTAHAVIARNRQDHRNRRYLLVEMADHFDTILVPRIKKVIYSDRWEDGKPQDRHSGVSHCLKYISLESYEDALDNITFADLDSQEALQFEDYVLSYILDSETKESDTLLNVAKLDSPFDYKLRLHGKDEPLPVDLPETFNYLIGLHVDTRKVCENGGTRYLVYRGRAEGRETVVIWRTIRGWGDEELKGDKEFILKHKLAEGAEDVFVNGDSFVPNARSLDPIFKQRMFSED